MSSHDISSPSSPFISPNPQQTLWEILAWNFPASVVKTLRSTPNIHSYELHLLYTMLISCQFRTPDHLFTKIHTLPSRVAAEIVSALEDLHIRPPVSTDRQNSTSVGGIPVSSLGCKPLFYTVEREELYSLVQKLFAAGHLGDKSHGFRLAEVHDFETLHVLYRLEAEHCRSKKYGGTELTEPNHEWYHETSDALVAQWTRCLWSLAEHVGEEGDREDGDEGIFIKLEPF